MELPNPADTTVGLGLRRRHSPAPPLAPLEYLQSQRRGSLTDPSLHAGPTSNINNSPLFRPGPKHHDPRRGEPQPRSPPPLPPPLSMQPPSPYVFGDASLQLPPPSTFSSRSRLSESPGEREKPWPESRSKSGHHNSGDEMDLDSDYRPGTATRDDPRLPPNFDYTMRRHSVPDGGPYGARIGIGHPRGLPPASSLLRLKRKVSSDRIQLPAVGEEVDSRSNGPSLPSSAGFDTEEPAAKRRNSAFDTQRMAQMSLYDRRDSMDSRASTGTPNSTWWSNERRDSASSMFSGTSQTSSAGVKSPGLNGELHCRQPPSMAAFAWPAKSSAPNDASAPQGVHPPLDPIFNRHYDAPLPPHSLPPLSAMPADRRMSAPDAMLAGPRADRALRSRSRPPPTAAGSSSRTAPTSPELSPTAKPDDASAPSGSSNSSQHLMPPKDLSSTPYSRSPELRVSHKLAERKRRKEMRDLFDELRDQLPADRGMKASKWEILSKAIDYIQQMKQSQNDLSREVELLRHEVESVRHGVPYPVAPHAVMYPPPGAHYGPPPATQPPLSTHTHALTSQQPPLSRPGSSHNPYTTSSGQSMSNGQLPPIASTPVTINGKA